MNAIVKVIVLLSLAIVIAPAGAAPEGATRAGGPGTLPRAPTAPLAVDPQIAALQQQVLVLQEQVALLQSVLQVTPTGTTLRAPSLLIVSTGGTQIRSDRETVIRAGSDIAFDSGSSLTIKAGGNMGLQSGSGLTIKAGAIAQVEGTSALTLRGSTIRLNSGARPIATVGSVVGNNAIVTGSATILAE